MEKNDFKYAYEVYKECIVDQVLLPEKLREAYYIVTGIDKEYEPIVSIRKCKSTIYNFFQYHAEKFMKEFEDFLNGNDENDPEEKNPENSQLEINDQDQTETTLDKNNETVYIEPEEQSHKENVENKEPEQVKYTGIKEKEPEKELTEEEKNLNKLTEELNNLKDNEENKEARRRLKIKITHLKKKIEKNG